MTTRTLFRISLVIFSVLIISTAIAQTNSPTCPALVTLALDATDQACAETGRNQACYGNINIMAQGVNETALDFDGVGDKADLTAIQSLELSGLDEASEQWGVALIRAQANLPDTLPGQNVTFLLFGDTYIETQVGETIEVPASALVAANVRLTPGSAGAVIGSLAAGTPVVATGRATADGSAWVRIRYAAHQNLTGWVSGDLLAVTTDDLPEVTTDSRNFNPMQAFYFTTGVGEATCEEAPLDGLVIQTPRGAGRVSLLANGVSISLGSTAILQANQDVGMNIFMLQGDGVVYADGVTQNVPAGSFTNLTLDENGMADGGPAAPLRFNYQDYDNLISRLGLIDPIPTLTNTPRPTATYTATVTPEASNTPQPDAPTQVPTTESTADPLP